MSANEDLFDRFLIRSTFLDRYREGESRRILRFLQQNVYPDILDEVERHIKRIRLRGTTSGFWKTKRYRTMLEAMAKASGDGFRRYHSRVASALEQLSIAEAAWNSRAISAVLPFSYDMVTPSPQLLRSVVRSRPFQGRLLRDWSKSLDSAVRTAVRREIDLGLVQGESVQQIVRRVRGTRSNGFRGPLRTSGHQAETVVRTAISHTITNSRAELYSANQDIIKGERYTATLDTGTTDICISLDGREFPIGEGEHPPMHMQCRSERLPILKSFSELGIPGLKDLPPSTRASLDGQVPARTTYADWLRRQPVSVQNDVLGVRKAQWFRSGRLSLRDLTDNANRPLTLGDLEELLAPA